MTTIIMTTKEENIVKLTEEVSKSAFKEIEEYAYSDDYSNEETPPDLTKYTGIHSNLEDENENVGTASTDELAELVHTDNRRKDPLDYDSHENMVKEIILKASLYNIFNIRK